MTDAPKIDTQAPDMSREAVERLASFHEGVARSFQDHIRGAYPVSHKGHAVVAATLRALLAERDLADARAADLQSRLDEMTRRRDAWREKAEGYDELAAAVRAGIEEAGDRDLSRVFLRGALVDSERRLKEEQERADARAAAAAQAMREAAAEAVEDRNREIWCDQTGEKIGFDPVAEYIRTILIPTDAQAALDRLIAERVREAVDRVSKLFEGCASGLVPPDYAQGYREALDHVRDAARGSKEGQS